MSVIFKPATAFYLSSTWFPSLVKWKGRSGGSREGRGGRYEHLTKTCRSPNSASSQEHEVRFTTGDSPYPDRKQKPKSGMSHSRKPDSTNENLKPPGSQTATHVAQQSAKEYWQSQKKALKQKFGEQGWSPRKKLSPDTLEGIRALHEQYPKQYTTPVLADQFQVSPEAIRRILKGNWRPSAKEMDERRARWARRHDRIWDMKAEMGLRPQRTKNRKPEGPEKLDDIIPSTSHLGL